MDRAQVRERMLPAVVVDDRSRPVEIAREPVQADEKARAHRWVDLAQAEAFVGDDPGHDRRMVAIALEHLLPFGREPPLGLSRMLVEAGHLRPDQEAERVGPVEPARILDLLMLPRPVEAERLRQLDVASKHVIARRRQQTAWEITLVENQSLNELLAVQPEPAISGFDGAQPEIAVDLIGDLAVLIQEPGFQLVEPRRIRMPGHHLLELDSPAVGRARPSADYLVV